MDKKGDGAGYRKMADPKAFYNGSPVYDDSFVNSTDHDVTLTPSKITASLQSPGTKRLFSNRDSSAFETSNGNHNEEDDNHSLSDNETRSEKRSRIGDWPLKSNGEGLPKKYQPPQRRASNGSDSPARQQRASLQVRHSKFVEGSMNDRVSTKPPSKIIHDELLEVYGIEQSDKHTKNNNAHRGSAASYGPHQDLTSVADKSDTSRHSSIFRFGKSLASSFNPSNWKIWSKAQPVEETALDKTLRERQEKAEKVYEQMKKTGQFKRTMDKPAFYEKNSEGSNVDVNKHHSGIKFNHRISSEYGDTLASLKTCGTSKQEKRYGRIFDLGPELDSTSPHQSPASEAPPRLVDPVSVFQKLDPKPPRSQVDDVQSAGGSSIGNHAARPVSSRKDLQKQQDLVRKVSDLEDKLEAARRELSKAREEMVLGSTWIGRRPFVSGVLPTLPSQQVLSDFTSPDTAFPTVESVSDIGKAISTADHSSFVPSRQTNAHPESRPLAGITFKKEAPWMSQNPILKLPNTSARGRDGGKVENQPLDFTCISLAPEVVERKANPAPAPPSNTPSKKRKSTRLRLPYDGIYKPAAESSDDDEEAVPPKKASNTPKYGTARPRKLAKVEPAKRYSVSEVIEKNDISLQAGELAESPVTANRNTFGTGRTNIWVGVHKHKLQRKGIVPPPTTPNTHSPEKMVAAEQNDKDDKVDRETVPQYPPPVPKLSSNVGSASGEVVRPKNTPSKSQGDSMVGGWKEVVEKRKTITMVDEDFEWPEDVF